VDYSARLKALRGGRRASKQKTDETDESTRKGITMNLRIFQRTAALAALSLLLVDISGAEKRGTGPRTSYEKSKESTTGSTEADAGSCLAAGDTADAPAVVAAFKRHSRRADELRDKIRQVSNAHNERQAQLREPIGSWRKRPLPNAPSRPRSQNRLNGTRRARSKRPCANRRKSSALTTGLRKIYSRNS